MEDFKGSIGVISKSIEKLLDIGFHYHENPDKIKRQICQVVHNANKRINNCCFVADVDTRKFIGSAIKEHVQRDIEHKYESLNWSITAQNPITFKSITMNILNAMISDFINGKLSKSFLITLHARNVHPYIHYDSFCNKTGTFRCCGQNFVGCAEWKSRY